MSSHVNHDSGFEVPEHLRAFVQRARVPGFSRWYEMLRSTGGCVAPIRLQGESVTFDPSTGRVYAHVDTSAGPPGVLLVPCGNRRASRCPACAEVYRRDTFHLIRAGLAGGKDVPDEVRGHPRVFATLTAPSFGHVHALRPQPDGTYGYCRPRRDGGECAHGRPVGCFLRHEPADALVGSALCSDCYDYTGAVLWNAHAGELWHRFTMALRAGIARAVGVSRSGLAEVARVSYAKVAEYQTRGLVHFHAVIRLDGPEGPADPSPGWASADLLSQAITDAARAVHVRTTRPGGEVFTLGFGDQLDIRPITPGDEGELPERAVAAYIAKYATKSATAATGTLDRPVKHGGTIDAAQVPEHARAMMRTAWHLGHMPAYAGLRLRKWTHQLGYRGHCTTKSRRYSVTFGQLRSVRAEHRAAQARALHGIPYPSPDTPLMTEKEWRYAGAGLTPIEAELAAQIHRSRPRFNPRHETHDEHQDQDHEDQDDEQGPGQARAS